jgi:hypothetical protein
MPDHETSQRSKRRRGKRRSRRPRRDNGQQEERSASSQSGRGKQIRSARDELPDVFIYTYTVYKSGDG